MKKKAETMLETIVKRNNTANIIKTMIEDFKKCLIKPEKVDFTNDNLVDSIYQNFTQPDEFGVMYCDLKTNFGVMSINGSGMFSSGNRIAKVTAVPEDLYYHSTFRNGLIHIATIAQTRYIITYQLYC
jgi:hypothetical protein